jgi:hypothetical protein
MPLDIFYLVQNITLEAIKVLGSAAIAAYATYRATAIQFESKIRELDKTNEFNARDRLYSYWKDRIARVESAIEILNGDLGRLLGMIQGQTIGNHLTEELEDFIKLIGTGAQTAAKSLAVELNTTLQDMREANLDCSYEFRALLEHQGFTHEKIRYGSFEEFKVSLFLLLEINNTMHICLSRTLHQKMRIVFDDYI